MAESQAERQPAEQEYRELQDTEYRDPGAPDTFPDGETVDADRRDAVADHGADREPTPDEERLADEQQLDPEVAETYEEAIERGAHVRGEGEIAPPRP
jgi:hypothetical protein